MDRLFKIVELSLLLASSSVLSFAQKVVGGPMLGHFTSHTSNVFVLAEGVEVLRYELYQKGEIYPVFDAFWQNPSPARHYILSQLKQMNFAFNSCVRYI